METAVLFFILAIEPFLVYFYWPFKLFCLDKGLQFKPLHQKAWFLFWGNWSYLSWGRGSLSRLLYKKQKCLMPWIVLFSNWSYFPLTRQVAPRANQDNTYILKTKTKQKFSLYCLCNCKSRAKFSITFRAVNENSSVFTQFDMLLLLWQNWGKKGFK